MSNEEIFTSYYFAVEIDSIQAAEFKSCSGLEIKTDVLELEEGGFNYSTRKFIGKTHFQNIILEHGITRHNNDLYNWFFHSSLADNERERKNGSIVLKSLSGQEIKRWNFFSAFPYRWVGPKLVAGLAGSYAIEKFEIVIEDVWGHIEEDADQEEEQEAVAEIAVEETAQEEQEPEVENIRPQPQTPHDPNDYHCDIMAWNNALDNDIDPRGQNGEDWDGNNLNVSGVFEMFPNNRNEVPPANTSGYAFTPRENPTHMIFYERGSGNTYTAHQSEGILPTTPQTWSVNGIFANDAFFVPLPALE